MKFLQKRQNEKSFTKSDYVVLSYEQLLQVNGAGGSSSGGGGPSGPSEQPSNNTSNNSSSGPNGIDNTTNPTIIDKFTSAGYELLSDKKDSTYSAGSRKEYMQSEFDSLVSQTDLFTVVKKELSIEGVRGEYNNPNNDYDQYTIVGSDGKTYMQALDINRDGKIDYVR